MEQKYIDTVKQIIEPLVKNISEINFTYTNNDDDSIVITVKAESHDLSVLIGKKGATASALRRLLNVVASANRDRLYLKFEPISE